MRFSDGMGGREDGRPDGAARAGVKRRPGRGGQAWLGPPPSEAPLGGAPVAAPVVAHHATASHGHGVLAERLAGSDLGDRRIQHGLAAEPGAEHVMDAHRHRRGVELVGRGPHTASRAGPAGRREVQPAVQRHEIVSREDALRDRVRRWVVPLGAGGDRGLGSAGHSRAIAQALNRWLNEGSDPAGLDARRAYDWLCDYRNGGAMPKAAAAPADPVHRGPKTGRNDPCPCGSGQKYKRCCGRSA